MTPKVWFGLVVAAALFTGAAHADAGADDDLEGLRSNLSNEWQLMRNDRLHNIRTYARLEDGKRYRSMKIEAQLDTSLSALARVFFDLENYPRWFWKTREAKILRRDSPTEFLAYMVHDAPFGLPNRDTVLRVTMEPQAKGKPYIVTRVSAVPNVVPLMPPLVRVVAEEFTMRFSQREVGKVDLEIEGYFDPGGFAPAWAANFVQRSAPYSVVLGLQRMVNRAEYKDEGKPLPLKVYEFGQVIP